MTFRAGAKGLADLGDEELVGLFQQGDERALATLLQRYRRFARAKARTYFLVGAGPDDVEQEGLIGVCKAARDFRHDRVSSFRVFADICVTRQVISAVKAATRQKHQPLNHYVSTSGLLGGDSETECKIEKLLNDHRVADPADAIISQESLEAMCRSIAEELSGLEVEVLRLYLSGLSYQEIGARLGRPVKSIDNALQRIKHKLDRRLSERPSKGFKGAAAA